jgi:hypothetical protein
MSERCTQGRQVRKTKTFEGGGARRARRQAREARRIGEKNRQSEQESRIGKLVNFKKREASEGCKRESQAEKQKNGNKQKSDCHR